MSFSEPTTNAAIRARYEAGGLLNDGAPKATETVTPATDADAVVGTDTDVLLVETDGTNTVDLSNAEEAGREVTVVVSVADGTAAAFDDADFVGTGPANLTAAGATATVANIDGTATGWVVTGTGSA